ncbi:hypothetical protein [Flammeovirga aprica]|uniref:LysM domain-containing protein n=1 Tax=Flammeovirga aprica JL-4 TaxID=694437 RepID=A0A7X9S177_9BACT|nr:hypothetical protein [Flammeovirga aprica]NME72485.1 hypothetical protein [Flammeovirga aprica JL-4]
MFTYDKKPERSSKEKSTEFGNPLFSHRKEVDPNDPPKIIIYVNCRFYTTDVNDLIFTFNYNKDGYLDENILRSCEVRFLWRDAFIENESKMPNSVFEKIREHLKNHFSGVKYINYKADGELPSPLLEAQDYMGFTKATIFSKTQNDNGHYISRSAYLNMTLEELATYFEMPVKYKNKILENYQTYKDSLPKELNYEELSKRIYEQVHKVFQNPAYIKAKSYQRVSELIQEGKPVVAYYEYIKSTNIKIQGVASVYQYFSGPDEDEIYQVLAKINNHPPSIEKLDTTFTKLYPEAESLLTWLLKEIPEHRKTWLQYLPNLNKEAHDLDYDTIAQKLVALYKEHLTLESRKPKGGRALTRYKTKYRIFLKNAKKTFGEELQKLEMNASSVDLLLESEYFEEKKLYDILTEMNLAKEFGELLPSMKVINWNDMKIMEDVSYSKEEIIQRGKKFREQTGIDRPFANGELIRYSDDNTYHYIVVEGDNISGIEKRFGIDRNELLLIMYWDGFDEKGRYLIGEDAHWLKEGDVIDLPSYYQPLNDEVFYSYDWQFERGTKVKKTQGEFVRIPIECSNHQELRQLFKEKIAEFDDNTKVYNLKFDIALSMSAQVTAFFYIGATVGAGIQLGSGDSRSFDVITQFLLKMEGGVGNKNLANAGASSGIKSTLNNLGHFNSLNGSYTSALHFLAFFERSLYSFMKYYELEEELKLFGLDEFYWENEKNKKDGVWDELKKGYVRKVRVSWNGQLEAGVNNVASGAIGKEYSLADSYAMKGITKMEELQIKDDLENIHKKATDHDKTITDYVELDIDGAFKVKVAFKDVLFSTNSFNLGSYIDATMTIDGSDLLENIVDIKNALSGAFLSVKDLVTQEQETDFPFNKKQNKWEKFIEILNDEYDTKVRNFRNKNDLSKEYIKRDDFIKEKIKHNKFLSDKIDSEQVKAEIFEAHENMLKNEGAKRKEWRPSKVKKTNYYESVRKRTAKMKGNLRDIDLEKSRSKMRKRMKDVFSNTFDKYIEDLKDDKIKKDFNNETYTKFNIGWIKVKDSYRLTNFSAFLGDTLQATAGNKMEKGSITASSEVEVYQYIFDNTISYTTMAFGGIFKEGLKRLNGEEVDDFEKYVKNAFIEVRNKGIDAFFSMISPSNMQLLDEYTKEVASLYNKEKDKYNGRTLESFYQGIRSNLQKKFQNITSSIIQDLNAKKSYTNPIDLTAYSPDQLKLLHRIKAHIIKEVDDLRYVPPITASELFQTYGTNDPKFIELRNKILGEKTAGEQWNKFKSTRDKFRINGEQEQEANHDNIKAVAENFSHKVKTAVFKYTDFCMEMDALLGEGKTYEADWSECAIDELTLQQAELYLGDIREIVSYLRRKKDSNETNLTFLKKEEDGISEYMKSVILNKNIKADKELLTKFEKDILYPLVLENIVYGKQVYTPIR